MVVSVSGIGLVGVDGVPVEVQVGYQDGLPGFDITGLPAASIRESRYRVKSALSASGYPWPKGRLVANFAPADLPKSGTAYDLPLAVAILFLQGVLPSSAIEGTVFFGELALNGVVRQVPGCINAAITARSTGARVLYLAQGGVQEASAVPGLSSVGVVSLVELVEILRGDRPPPAPVCPAAAPPIDCRTIDLGVVKGQLEARRALEIAAAGGHNMLMVGPPGCGKTLLAKALPGIMAPMELSERLEVTRIHSVSQPMRRRTGLVEHRPFRAPHATASKAALVGGGNPPHAGEVTLAHCGVLFLDEVLEFSRPTLESLRAPLEDRTVVVSRVGCRTQFPASFALLCAMNPCPCGYHGDEQRSCRCTRNQIQAYRDRLSGPLLDRIDLQVRMRAIPPEELAQAAHGTPSEEVRMRVVKARKRQKLRNQDVHGWRTNAELNQSGLTNWAPLGPSEISHMVNAARILGLTARSWTRVIKVGRTIADLADSDCITVTHLSEALAYRVFERQEVATSRTPFKQPGAY